MATSPLRKTTQEIVEFAAAVSRYPTVEEPNPWVSQTSRWLDSKWYLDNSTPGALVSASTIYWEIELKDGISLLAPQHAQLLHEMRHFVWSLFVDRRGRAALKTGSAGFLRTGMAALSRWMVEHNYASLGELNGRASQYYIDAIIDEATRRWQDEEEDEFAAEVQETVDHDEANFEDEADAEKEIDQGSDSVVEITESYLYPRLRIWSWLWQQRHAMADIGIAPPREQPFAGASVQALRRKLATKVAGRIPPIPDEAALLILNAAHAFMETHATELLGFAETAGQLLRHGPLATNTFKRYLRKAFFADHDGKEARAIFTGRDPLTKRAREMMDDMVDACGIILQSETGLRVSELCGIKTTGIDPETGLPSCIEVRPSKSGMLDLYYLRSVLAKTRKAPEEKIWLLAAKPRGAKGVPNAVRAVEVVYHLLQPWRALCRGATREMLFVNFTHSAGLPQTASGITSTQSQSIMFGQKRFISGHVDFSGLPDTQELRVYKQTKGKCVRTHQWRKVYARYVFQVNPKLLPAIARQFKHLSLAMTEGAYIGTDIGLIKDVAQYNRNQVTNLFLQYARGQNPRREGRFAKLMEKYQPEMTKLVTGKSEEQARNAIEAWVVDRDIKLFFHGYGACMPALAPTEAECHKKAQTIHWANNAPNYSTREPVVCTGCYLFLAGPETADYWRGRYIDNMTSWLEARKQGRENQYRVAKARADQSAIYLKTMGVPLPIVEESNAR